MIMPETELKARILTHGVVFTKSALLFAKKVNAKCQNLVYNAPAGSSKFRPQELLIKHVEGFETVVSCVAPSNKEPVIIDYADNKIIAKYKNILFNDIDIRYVEEPEYYSFKLGSNLKAKDYVSACGFDELNIIPWKGCNISKGCLFCGVNTIASENSSKIFTANQISTGEFWNENKDFYLNNLIKSIKEAVHDKCYDEHMHVILISGDLSDSNLDMQTHIYSEIVKTILPYIYEKSTEGVVAVCMPPRDLNLLQKLKDAGVNKVVFNFEVANKNLFNKYCPGKKNIGYNHILKALKKGVEVFGKGNSWTNFVLGLEPYEELLKFNEYLAIHGIVSSANVLHLDKGNRLDCKIPTFEDVVNYYYSLDKVLIKYGLNPFYCSKALRTSLTNEARYKRIIL